MNIADYFAAEEKPTAPSLKWWIEHPARPLQTAEEKHREARGIPVFLSTGCSKKLAPIRQATKPKRAFFA